MEFETRENEFDFYWNRIFEGLPWNPIEFNTYRFDESLSLPAKFNKLYEMFKQLALNNQQVMDYLKEFVNNFDTNLTTSVEDILNVWYNSGKFNDLFQSQVFKDFTDELARKRDKDVLLTWADMDTSKDESKFKLENLSEEVLNAMTGDTPISPVLPDRSVAGVKLELGAVGSLETGYLVNNYRQNLFDGNYRMGSVRAGAENNFYLEGTENPDYKLAVVSVSPDTTYIIRRSLPSRFNIATSTKSIGEGESFDGAIKRNYSLSGTSYYPMYIQLTTGPNDRYMYLSMSLDNTEPYLCISTLHPKLNRIYYYQQPNRTVDLMQKTNYIDLYNLFTGEYERNTSIEGSEPFNYIYRDGGRTAIMSVVPNTDYTLIRETPSRFNWGTATRILELGEPLDGSIKMNQSGSGETTSPTVVNFRTGSNDYFLYVNTSVTNEDKFLKVVEGTVTNVGNFNYTDKKLDNSFKEWLINFIHQESTVAGNDTKISCRFTYPDLLEIFVPCSSGNYVKYDYRYVDVDSINMHQWRVLKTYITDSSFNVLQDLDTQTEWEGAIREVGASDFMGGTHGDETNTSISFLFDGKEVPMTSSFNIDVDWVKIVNHSLLNRVGDTSTNLLRRIKIQEWTKETYKIENDYKCLVDFEIDQSKIVMASARYNNGNSNLIRYGRRNTDFFRGGMSASGVGGLGNKTKTANYIEMWGDNLYIGVELASQVSQYPNTNQYIENFNNESIPRAKIYYDITGNYSIKAEEKIKTIGYYTVRG